MKINDVLDDLDNFDVEGGSSQAIKKQTKSSIAAQLPQMPKNSSRSKFSSWNTEDPKSNGMFSSSNNVAPEDPAKGGDENFMDEVDELLLEQDLLSPTQAKNTLKNLTNKNSGNKKSTEIRPLNGESPTKKGKRVVNQNESLRDSTIEQLLNGKDIKDLSLGNKKISKQDIKKKLSNSLKEGDEKLAFDDDDEFDLDNSDDLNRFINKYESLITNKDKSIEKQGSASKTPIISSKKSQPKFKSSATQNDEDIDFLVEEELSRNHSERSEGEAEAPNLDGVQNSVPRVMKVEIQTKSQNTPSDRGATNIGMRQSTPAGSQKSQEYQNSFQSGNRMSAGGNEDHLNSSQGSNGGESQMFKELFSTANKGIAGIAGVSGLMDEQSSGAGMKLVSELKNQEIQINAQQEFEDKALGKQRSKKDLKNKYQSSAVALYNDPNGDKQVSDMIKQHLSENDEDKENQKKAGEAGIIDDSEVDEIIKQHLMEEEKHQKIQMQGPRATIKKKPKKKGNSDKDASVKKSKEKKALNEDLQEDQEDQDHTKSDDEDTDNSGTEEEEDDIMDETEKKKKIKAAMEDDDEDSDNYDYMDDSLNLNVKSPKQTLIEHLRLLADIFNSSLDGASDYYDQIFDERAQFMLDFENILKIMTFDETVEYVLPCMQIYSSEQDYLKLKLFQNLEKLFKKLFKAEVFIPKPEIIDIITINIFPLASRMLMLSEEPVQIEGVEALLNLSKQYIPKDQAQNLVQKVIQVIMDRISNKSEHQETEDVKEKAKIAVLIIVQKFSEEDIFQKSQCEQFLDTFLEEIQDGMLFKIKKFLLPALIAISKHLEYDVFLERVYGTFKTFNADEIWGVRKVCIENLANLIQYLKNDEIEKFNDCIDFFKRCLNDSNRWVKNQSLVQFGPIVHQMYLKIHGQEACEKKEGQEAKHEIIKASPADAEKLQELINKTCLIFYDMKMVLSVKEDSDFEDSLMNKLDDYSFMQNKNDDVDKIKYYWAYNMPCAIMVNGGQKFWFSHLQTIYELLYKDILINTRTTMSAGFKEVIELLEIEKMEKAEDRQFFVTVLNHYLKDSEEISSKVLPTICKLVSKFPDSEKTELLDNLIRTKIESIKSMKNGRDNMVAMLEQLFEMFQPTQLMESNFQDYLFDIIKKERAINYKMRAAKVLGSKIVAPLIKGKKYRSLLTSFTDDLRNSKNFRDRQVYLQIAISTYESDNEIFKKHFAKNIAQDMETDSCRCVQIMLAKLCNEVKDGYSKSLDKVRQKLMKDNEETVIQYMPTTSELANDSLQNRRYLALNYGDEKSNKEEEKAMTEEEWLEKEKKEIEEVEKTVNIRFANYTTLMRAQTLTQGLSAQLAMFLSNMGGGASAQAASSLLAKTKDSDDAFNKKLLEKAGIKTDEKSIEAPKRSLSPMDAETTEEEEPNTGIIVTKKEISTDNQDKDKDWNV